jgi:hypothetical protein
MEGYLFRRRKAMRSRDDGHPGLPQFSIPVIMAPFVGRKHPPTTVISKENNDVVTLFSLARPVFFACLVIVGLRQSR